MAALELLLSTTSTFLVQNQVDDNSIVSWNHLVGLTQAHHLRFSIPCLQNVQVLSKTLLTIGLQPILKIQNSHGIKQ